MTYRKLLRHNF